jgi:hypothetical protein
MSRGLEAEADDAGESCFIHAVRHEHKKRPFSSSTKLSTHLQVHRAPNGTYEGALAVFSEYLVLFLKRDTPLELSRVTTSPRVTGNINGDDAPPASLRVEHPFNFHRPPSLRDASVAPEPD